VEAQGIYAENPGIEIPSNLSDPKYPLHPSANLKNSGVHGRKAQQCMDKKKWLKRIKARPSKSVKLIIPEMGTEGFIYHVKRKRDQAHFALKVEEYDEHMNKLNNYEDQNIISVKDTFLLKKINLVITIMDLGYTSLQLRSEIQGKEISEITDIRNKSILGAINGVLYLHEKHNVAHADLNGSNVVWSRDGKFELKLIDGRYYESNETAFGRDLYNLKEKILPFLTHHTLYGPTRLGNTRDLLQEITVSFGYPTAATKRSREDSITRLKNARECIIATLFNGIDPNSDATESRRRLQTNLLDRLRAAERLSC